MLLGAGVGRLDRGVHRCAACARGTGIVLLADLVGGRRKQQPVGSARAELSDHFIRAPAVAPLVIDPDEQHLGARRPAGIRGGGQLDQLPHGPVVGRGRDEVDPEAAQLRRRDDLVAPGGAGPLRELAQLALGLLIFAEGGERFDDFQPGREMAMVLHRQTGPEARSGSARSNAAPPDRSRAAGSRGRSRGRDPKPARDSAPPRPGCGRSRPAAPSALPILALVEQHLGERRGGVDILVGRAAAGEALGQPAPIGVAIADDDDMLPGAGRRRRLRLRLSRSGGGGCDQQDRRNRLEHAALPQFTSARIYTKKRAARRGSVTRRRRRERLRR